MLSMFNVKTIIDNKLNFDANTCEIVKRCNQRMFCLYRLRSFDVARNTLQMFYKSFIQSVLTFSFLCWYSPSLSVKNRNKLGSIVKRASKAIGIQQESMSSIFECSARTARTLSKFYQTEASGRRLRSLKVNKVKTRNSFVSHSIKS